MNDPSLWESLRSDLRRTSGSQLHPDSIVELRKMDNRKLRATLLVDGLVKDSYTFTIKQRELWLELSPQHIAHPFLWYAFWGLETNKIALSIECNGDLLVNTIGNGVFMVFIVPTIGGGGGPGAVSFYERAAVVSGEPGKHVPLGMDKQHTNPYPASQ